jgi:Arm DNA-binding domain
LRLVVSDSLFRRGMIRITVKGKRRERGLGRFPTVSLEAARERATAIRKAAQQGRDLARDERRWRAEMGVTFAEALDTYFQHKQRTLSNGKHVAQWRSTLQRYVTPKIGAIPVAQVDAEAILDVLGPCAVQGRIRGRAPIDLRFGLGAEVRGNSRQARCGMPHRNEGWKRSPHRSFDH